MSRIIRATLNHSKAIAILTEWEEFKHFKWDAISKVSKVFDGRKIIKKNDLNTDSNLFNRSMILDSKIAVIGLGYVGLPLSIEFAKYFDVLGYDIDTKRLMS